MYKADCVLNGKALDGNANLHAYDVKEPNSPEVYPGP